jgi:hypothetical protein
VQLFQGSGKKVILLAIIRHVSPLSWGGRVLLSSELFLSRPRCALRKASKVDIESNIPPMLAASRSERDLSFRSLARLSSNIRSTTLEMI